MSESGMRRIVRLTFPVFFALCLAPVRLSGQTGAVLHCAGHDIAVDVTTQSGTPLVLHFSFDDPDTVVERVRLDTGVAVVELEVGNQTEFSVTAAPYIEPGVYDLELSVDTAAGRCTRTYRVGSADFVWGRDNFRFGNNGSSNRGAVKPYSENLFAWASERFGELTDAERILLLRRTYDLFKGAIGRCYAFTASQARYMADPDLLPDYYPHIYNVFPAAATIQRDMNRLQNDVVFQYFVTDGYDVHHRQTENERTAEVYNIIERIERGGAAVYGYLGPDRHHSMLAYGFIEDREAGTVKLVSANNWSEEQTNNLAGDDTEIVLVHTRPDPPDGRGIRWLDAPVRAYDYAEKIVFIDPGRVDFPDRETLDYLVAEETASLRGYDLLVIESAAGAVLVDPAGRRSGREGFRRYEELSGVRWRRHGENIVFEVPVERRDGLELRMDRLDGDDGEILPETRLFAFSPADVSAGSEPVYVELLDISMNPDEPTRFGLGALFAPSE